MITPTTSNRWNNQDFFKTYLLRGNLSLVTIGKVGFLGMPWPRCCRELLWLTGFEEMPQQTPTFWDFSEMPDAPCKHRNVGWAIYKIIENLTKMSPAEYFIQKFCGISTIHSTQHFWERCFRPESAIIISNPGQNGHSNTSKNQLHGPAQQIPCHPQSTMQQWDLRSCSPTSATSPATWRLCPQKNHENWWQFHYTFKLISKSQKKSDIHRSMVVSKDFLGMYQLGSKIIFKKMSQKNRSHSSHLFVSFHPGASKPFKSSAFDRRRRRLMRRRVSWKGAASMVAGAALTSEALSIPASTSLTPNVAFLCKAKKKVDSCYNIDHFL